MKRFIALVLSLVMALSLCAPAWGADAVKVDSSDALAKAITEGATEIELAAGVTYQMPAAAKGKTLTISGTDAATTIIQVVPGGQGEANGQLDYSLDSSTVTFNKVTIQTNSQLYAGYARLSAVYNDCIIQNTYNLGVGTSEFNRCTFNITNEYLRVGGATSAVFNGCTFNTDGRAILVFQDGTQNAQTVTVKDCTFNATAAAKTWNGIHVAAVSYDGSQGGTYVVNFEGENNVDEDFNGLWQIKGGEANVTVNYILPPAVEIGDVGYDTLQDAVDAVKDGETITVNVADETAVVGEVKSFTVVGEDVTITAAAGYDVAVADGKYVVTVAKADIKDEEIKTDVTVVAPEVKVEVETDNDVEDAVVNTLNNAEKPVEFDEKANEALEAVIPEVTVSAEDAAEALVGAQIPVVNGDTVNVVVQPYFDVTVEEVNVVTDATTGTVASASIKLDISPMYQTVVTTADTAAEIELEGDDQNAVVVDKQPVTETITESVTIKIAIPAALAMDDGNGGFKPLFVTHEKDNGTKYVYEAKVETDGNGGYTATFVNPNGFSSFTLSTENNTVAVVGDMNYATLQGAIDNAGKGAVIEVMVSGLEADINAPFSFKLQLAEGVTEPTFNVAEGYTMSKWYVNGVYTYIVQSASAGGYAPVAPSTPEKVVTSPKTFDAGIALYVGMSVMAAAGSAVVLKKRED